ncbi:putative Tetratricopeptide TPR_2 repeat protein [Rhodospirillaceae bacterium LM-1]|nr:putative Tetratricopeptide TPR_2 repeat protein [Rhodospirillaceae bacterium LM-1]
MQNRPQEALTSFQEAAKLDALNLAAWGGMGEAQARLGDAMAARQSFDHLCAMIGSQAGDLGGLGGQLFGHGWNHAALALWLAAEKADPASAIWPANQAAALKLLGRSGEAKVKAWWALGLDPGLDAANRALGELAEDAGDLQAAIRHFSAIAKPDAQVLAHLAQSHLLIGDGKQAAEDYRRAASLEASFASAALMALHYRPDLSFAEIVERHLEWGQHFSDPGRPPWRHKKGQPLRLGFVSSDFRHHATGVFLPPLLQGCRQGGWKVTLYSNTKKEDAFTQRFKEMCDEWRDIRSLDDAQAADLVRADGTDILFDLNGHTAGNRLGLFALRPAPMQITFMDYVCTTGLRQMDFLIHDGTQLPPENAERFTEKVLYLEPDALVYAPPAYAPDVSPAPCLKNGFVTFGSFNALFKIGEDCIELWSAILRELPDSRLLIAAPNLKYDAARERAQALFRKHGVDAGRLTLLGEADHLEHLSRYGEVDVVLDSQPYSGGLTTCEALWMGVPVIAMLGERIAGRHAASHLKAVGLGDLVATDFESYARLAVELARDKQRLISLHSNLRNLVLNSPLCDTGRYLHRFMSILVANTTSLDG